ncbi:MAG TPA: DUF6680 family protein [Candidatus Acidoferrum sp.]|nr:DUF6680 family protein [Candidatus Acidoferrum sp.]
MDIGVVGAVLSGLTVVAILYGPIAALKIQRKLDEEREVRNRKLSIFKTLMSYRVTRVSPLYVQALNSIDVEFTGNDEKERAVREAWRELNDLYANYKTTPNADEKTNELSAALLAAMGKSLGYDFDKVYLKKGGYYPEFLANVETEQHALRRLVLELLDGSGRRKLPVATFEQEFPDVRQAVETETGKKE